MQAELAIIADGKKFMWDGRLYDSQAEAESAAEKYRAGGFEVRMITEGEKFRLYTRRVVQQVAPTP